MSQQLIRANTFSFCAVDVETGDAGVAVASKCLSVAGHVCYAQAGVGAIATQAVINPEYGVKGLALLREGLSACEVVEQLVSGDVTVTEKEDEPYWREMYGQEGLIEEGADYYVDRERDEILWKTRKIRQLGVVDRDGGVYTYTGEKVNDWAGSVIGIDYCCQGNLLVGQEVLEAMEDAFERKRKEKANIIEQLYAALAAGDEAGGDKRGKQAAGILVMRKGGHWTGSDKWCDVRVDDHQRPVEEVGRILRKVGFVK